MRVAVWTFTKPRPTTITPSDKVANILAELIGAPIVWNEDWAPKFSAKKTDVLFMVNGSFSFCQHLPAVAPALINAKRAIWVQNDYNVVPPKSSSIGETPFRAAFRKRKEAGKPEVEFWTTCDDYITRKRDRYINWNALAYSPIKPKKYKPNGKAVYYGYFRDFRQASFDKYFKKGGELIDVYSPSKDFAKFYPALNVIPPVMRTDKTITWEQWLRTMRGYSAGLYLEDSKSTANYHSPATRFYEMLSAGVPIAFDEQCVGTFEKYSERSGYDIDVKPFTVRGRKSLRAFMENSRQALKAQNEWHHDYYNDTIKRAKKLLRKVLRE